MSEKYDEYLKEHKDNVYKGFVWLKENLPDIFYDGLEGSESLMNICENLCRYSHDASKNDPYEYDAYDAYFYGNRSYEVVQNFDRAWLMHIHKNQHHWQHWILTKDDPDEPEVILDMPDCYIIEMICDWWSFSWKSEELREIFNWYEKHKNHMKLSDYTRMKVENILQKISDKLAD